MTILNDADVRDGVRYFTATVDGVRYEISEMWAIGYCTTHGGSAIEAAQAWHEQALMEAEFKAQENLLQEAIKKARYGHNDWLHWTDSNGMQHIARKSAETVKRAMLASGTQGYFLLVSANCGTLMQMNWRLGIIALNNARYGY